jgi:hypothetical protein
MLRGLQLSEFDTNRFFLKGMIMGTPSQTIAYPRVGSSEYLGRADLNLNQVQLQGQGNEGSVSNNTAVGGLKTADQLQKALTLLPSQFQDEGGGVYKLKDGSEIKRAGDNFELTDKDGKRYQLNFSETGVVLRSLDSNQFVARPGEAVYLTEDGLKVGSMATNAKSVTDCFGPPAASNSTTSPVVVPQPTNPVAQPTTAGVTSLNNLQDSVQRFKAGGASELDVAQSVSNVVNTVQPDGPRANYNTLDEAMAGVAARVDELGEKIAELAGKEPLTAKQQAEMQRLQNQMEMLKKAQAIANQAARVIATMLVV